MAGNLVNSEKMKVSISGKLGSNLANDHHPEGLQSNTIKQYNPLSQHTKSEVPEEDQRQGHHCFVIPETVFET